MVQASTRPDIVINLEIGIASDFPLLTSPTLSQEALGKGPGIFVFDGSMIPNNKYVDWIIRLAKENNIPFQFESVTRLRRGCLDATKIGTGYSRREHRRPRHDTDTASRA